eukprot:UN12748
MCCGPSFAGNNWGKGYYTEGAELLDEAFDIVRRETESCDCLSAFQITHSIGGGTGSGFGALLMQQIKDNYPDRLTTTFTVFPSQKVSDVVVEPYNAMLSLHKLLESYAEGADMAFVMDNEALFNITHNLLKKKEPSHADLNWLISLVMSDVTASIRFGGYLNSNFRKMAVNLIPFYRLKFLSVCEAPLFLSQTVVKENIDVQQLTNQIWSETNCYANIQFQDGKYLTSSCIYRGTNLSTQVH